MADRWDITVDADKVLRGLERYRRREHRAAERAGVAAAAALGRTVAREEADPGARPYIKSRTRSRGGRPYGQTVITHGGYRLLASGTQQRQTRAGHNRGFVVGDPFMERTAQRVDPVAARLVERVQRDRLQAAGLRVD